MSLKQTFTFNSLMVLAISFNAISLVEAQETIQPNSSIQRNAVAKTQELPRAPTKPKTYNPKGPDFEPYQLIGSRVKVEIDADLLSKDRRLTINFLAQFDPDFYAFINPPMGDKGSLRVYTLASRALKEKEAQNMARAAYALSQAGKLDLDKFVKGLETDVLGHGGASTQILNMVINHGGSEDPREQKIFLQHLATHYPKQFKRAMAEIVQYYKGSETMLKANPPKVDTDSVATLVPEPGQ